MPNGDDPGYFVVGDSIGQGIAQAGGYDGVTKVGANPQWVLDQINDPNNAGRIKGRNVILSSGVTNDPRQMDRVDRQLDALTRLGANHVYVAGTSNSRQDLAGLNATLQDIASSRGYTFGGGYEAGKDQIHPASYGDYHRTLLAGPAPASAPGLSLLGSDTASIGPRGPAMRAPSPTDLRTDVNALVTGMRGGQDPGDEFAWKIRELGEKTPDGRMSPAGALGQMQVLAVNPKTGLADPNKTAFKPGFNIEPAKDLSHNELNRVGVEYAKALLARYDGNTALASAAYNAGYGRVDQWLKTIGDPRTGSMTNEQWIAKIPFDETRNYASRVTGGDLGVPGQSPLVARAATSQAATAGQPPPAAPVAPSPAMLPGQLGPPVTATPRTPAGSIEAATPGLTLGPGSVPTPGAERLTLGSPTNPLQVSPRVPPATVAGMPSLSAMVAMSLLQKMVPSTHTLEPIPHNPFAAVPQFRAAEFPAAQLHVIPEGAGTRLPETPMAGQRMPEIRPPGRLRVPSQMPGRRVSIPGMLERVLGDTGEPSIRGREQRAGTESQYG